MGAHVELSSAVLEQHLTAPTLWRVPASIQPQSDDTCCADTIVLLCRLAWLPHQQHVT